MLERTVEAKDIVNHNKTTGLKLEELVQFSANIYQGLGPVEGWELIYSIENESGYKGACFAKGLLTKDAQVVLVHRGTVLEHPNIIASLVNDIEVALNIVPTQAQYVLMLLQASQSKIEAIYGNDPSIQYLSLTSTGHSLGAVLSDVTAYYARGAMQSVTFENPGSKDIIIGLMAGAPPDTQKAVLDRLKGLCIAYQAGVNLINTCNEQTGNAFRIDGLTNQFKPSSILDFPPSVSYLTNFTYCIDYTLYEHLIGNILTYITNGNGSTAINSINGHQPGYVAYLDPQNTSYWDGFFKYLWDTPCQESKYVHDKYKEDYSAYIKGGYEQLTSIYNEASKQKLFNSKFNFFKESEKEIENIINEFVVVENKEPQEIVGPVCNVM